MGWAKLPDGWSFIDVYDVAVDSEGRVYVANGSDHPIIVLDRGGNFLDAWGEGSFEKPHGLIVGPDDTLYCADRVTHTVRRFTLDGQELMTLGVAGQPASTWGGDPFNGPTGVALHPRTGEMFISDGYGNGRVHKYSADGEHLLSWGEPGTDPGQFSIPHNICSDAEGRVYVADRENYRVQVFDSEGNYLTQWNNMMRPCSVRIDHRSNVCFIAEMSPSSPFDRSYPNTGSRIRIMSLQGEQVGRLGDDRFWGEDPHQWIAPHGLAIDTNGDLYVGEASWTAIGRHQKPPREMHCLRKLVKV